MHVLFWKNGDCNVLLPRHSLCLELMHNIPQWKKKIINLDGIQGMLCYNASDIAFMGISSFWSNFLNTSHHLLINFKTGTEWKLKKKKEKAKKTRENTHSWQQTETDRQLEFHTLNLSTAPCYILFLLFHLLV